VTWEETIKFIRTQVEYADLVEKAYLEESLELNVTRYMAGEEWKETLRVVQQYSPEAKSILDVGSGNGISAIAFALSGYNVTALEPESSETIGAGAIRKLKGFYKLSNISISEEFAENAVFEGSFFDVVYCRQSMHHAQNLKNFIRNISSELKKGGLFLAIRDHVIFSRNDKRIFLQAHPLQKYYGGENAFKPSEYRYAIRNAGLRIVKELKYFDSVINFFPLTESDIQKIKSDRDMLIKKSFVNPRIISSSILIHLLNLIYSLKSGKIYDERRVPGRMYSYIAIKI
jgi:2-polyprenyl-3-methyl-5-hydroxy-6-metoxy-1,4-benzoquinol methylase